jgi:hypothetical protein
MTDINWYEIFHKNSWVHPFWPQIKEEILEWLRAEPVDKKLRRYKSIWKQHVKNEQQEDAKNNAELQTKWTKTT